MNDLINAFNEAKGLCEEIEERGGGKIELKIVYKFCVFNMCTYYRMYVNYFHFVHTAGRLLGYKKEKLT